MFFPLRSHYPEIQTVAARHTAVIIEQNIVGSSAFSSPQTPIKPCHWTPGTRGVLLSIQTG